jgi:hypothetical protein
MAGQFLPEADQTPTVELERAKLQAPVRYLGSAACVRCHASAAKVWQGTGHAHAQATLAKAGEANSLDCLQCHTVGLYEPTGYDPDEPRAELSAVGCESCHGPGSQHVAAAELAKLERGKWPAPPAGWSGARYSIARGDQALCLKCHDHYNSPHFNPAAYWAKIKH